MLHIYVLFNSVIEIDILINMRDFGSHKQYKKIRKHESEVTSKLVEYMFIIKFHN